MKKIFLFVFILYLSDANLFAQKEGYNWCFGDSCGIDFNSTSPTFFQTSLTTFEQALNHESESQCSLSDSNGNLLFYTNGHLIWNKLHQGFNHSLNKYCYLSITNGVICLPFPGHDSLKALIYVHGGLDSTGLYYSIVNMNLDNGLGDIDTTKWDVPIMLSDTIDERLTAVKHANGRDWWVIWQIGNSFHKFLFSPNGLLYDNEQQIGIGIKYQYGRDGEICFSKDGSKLLRVSVNAQAEIMDFDRCSGIFSNAVTLVSFIPTANQYSYYGCSLSPSGNMIYISSYDTLYQFCYADGNYTKNVIWVDSNYLPPPTPGGYCMAQMELAPDGRIYLCSIRNVFPNQTYSYYNQHLCVINQPDSCGLACDFQAYSFSLNGKRSAGGLPNMPNYNLGKLVGSACDTLTSIQNENLKTKSLVNIFPNPVTEQLTIEVLRQAQHDNNEIEIEITDVMGREIFNSTNNLKSQIINLKSFSSGIYFVKIYMNDGSVEVRKFVKE